MSKSREYLLCDLIIHAPPLKALYFTAKNQNAKNQIFLKKLSKKLLTSHTQYDIIALADGKKTYVWVWRSW